MREIKYRGLNEETGEWVYGWYTKLVEGIRRFDAIIADVDGELTRFYIHNKETIGQYTGLRDNNGKEIYEGDILSYYSALVPKGSNPIVKQVVTWKEYQYAGINNWGGAEIIGNIHENPELLEGRE